MISRRELFAGGASAAAAFATGDWETLFDGGRLNAWMAPDGGAPAVSWRVENRELRTGGAGERSDIVTRATFSDFELRFEFQLARGANSGVKYLVSTALQYLPNSRLQGAGGMAAIGLELQLMDPAASEFNDPRARTGSLYGLLPAAPTPEPDADRWSRARLLVSGDSVEHWIQDTRVLSYRLDEPRLLEALRAAATTRGSLISMVGAASALRAFPRPSVIALQNHTTDARFRSIRIRRL